MRPGPGKTEVSRTDAAADCVLSGPAAGLYAFLWNRCTARDAGIEVTGDASVLATWNSSALREMELEPRAPAPAREREPGQGTRYG